MSEITILPNGMKFEDVKADVKNVVVKEVVEEVDGRLFSCSCFGWKLALQMSRIPKQTAPTKPEEPKSEANTSPAPSAEKKE